MGCGLLRNIAAMNAECQECAVSRGAVDVVREALKAHQEAVRVQTAGCWALYCLSVRNAEVGLEVSNYGGAWVAIKAMEVHRKDARVQEAGCWVLKELAKPVAADRGALAAGVSAVLRAMEHHVKAPSPELQEAASGALRALGANDSQGWVKQICLGRRGRLSRPTSKNVRCVMESIQEGTGSSDGQDSSQE